jgi:hypothetical protein
MSQTKLKWEMEQEAVVSRNSLNRTLDLRCMEGRYALLRSAYGQIIKRQIRFYEG